VFHPFKNLKAPAQNGMGPASFNIRHKADSAGIVFIFAPVQTPLIQSSLLRAHNFPLALFSIFIQKQP
jgi:hypothetical protein